MRRVLAAGVLTLVVATVTVLGAVPAFAHPLGMPALALVDVTGERTFTVEWSPSPDDLVVLARSLGLPAADDTALSAKEGAELAASPALRDYLAAHLVASQAAGRCEATVEVPGDLASRSPRYDLRCPAPLGAVRLSVTLLTDLDERYRTLAVAPTATSESRLLFSVDDPSQVVRLGSADTAAGPAPVPGEMDDDGAAAAGEAVARARGFGGSLAFEERVLAFVDAPDLTLPAALAGLAVAFVVGAAHALAPGHGKAIAAAYLVGDRGRPRDAVLLGASVSAMHTASVLVLGGLLYWLAVRPAAAALSGWLSLTSGAVVLGIGVWLVVRRWREYAHGRGAVRVHADVDRRGHDHDHAEGHDHTHLPPPGVSPLSRRGLVALGAAGGLLPSPTALLVLLTALSLGRLAFGLTLVGAFSLGLAATLTAAGLAVLWGRDTLRRRLGERPRTAALLGAIPLLGAGAVVVVGVVLVVRALTLL